MDFTGKLRHINSMTKYPSIPTYHQLDPTNGMLQDGLLNVDMSDFGPDFYATEKIDGTNARIILFPDGDWIIGSREELLCSQGDRIINPTLGIVDALHSLVQTLALAPPVDVTVIYGEVYGGNVQGAKNYTNNKKEFGFRVFDVIEIVDFEELLLQPLEEVAKWRDGGGQVFFTIDELAIFSSWRKIALVPFIAGTVELASELVNVLGYLKVLLPNSRAVLDDGGRGVPEGIVIRTEDRSQIAKVRFEDYEKTLRRMTGKPKSR